MLCTLRTRNKTIKFLLLFTLLLIAKIANAFIPSAKYILERTALNLSSTPVYFEKEVVINNSFGSASLREIWLVENDTNFKVIVQGTKDLKDKLQFSINFNSKNKQTDLGPHKSEPLSNEFFEPIFFKESKSELVSFLISHGVLPTQFHNSKNFTKSNPKSFNYTPEQFLKLSRTGGKVSYFLFNGRVESNPSGIWIEQDLFNILKIRTEQGATMSFEDLVNYSKEIHLPKITTIAWSNNQAQLTITEARSAKAQHQAIFKKSTDYEKDEYLNSPMKSTIEEFYSRFR